MSTTQDTGSLGEQAAAEYLHEQGYEILHRNWRTGRYELDIVARKDEYLCFVEVKTRRADGLTTPEEALTGRKMRSLARAADAYVKYYGPDLEPRFDLVAVDTLEGEVKAIRHIPGAGVLRW